MAQKPRTGRDQDPEIQENHDIPEYMPQDSLSLSNMKDVNRHSEAIDLNKTPDLIRSNISDNDHKDTNGKSLTIRYSHSDVGNGKNEA